MVESITVLGGHGRLGESDGVSQIELHMGDVVSIVGPTGSGKTTLINDIELFADADTPSGRRVLVDGRRPPDKYRTDPALHPVALITQHTTFLSDLPVDEFLRIHARIRGTMTESPQDLVFRTLAFANQLTGEPVPPDVRMTELSGGQTRALLIADATVICSTPIVLLDEVENAGIDRGRAIELLRTHRKIFLFVTHDPRIALLCDYRIIMRHGRIMEIIPTSEEERSFGARINRLDDAVCRLRDRLRLGHRLTGCELEGFV